MIKNKWSVTVLNETTNDFETSWFSTQKEAKDYVSFCKETYGLVHIIEGVYTE